MEGYPKKSGILSPTNDKKLGLISLSPKEIRWYLGVILLGACQGDMFVWKIHGVIPNSTSPGPWVGSRDLELPQLHLGFPIRRSLVFWFRCNFLNFAHHVPWSLNLQKAWSFGSMIGCKFRYIKYSHVISMFSESSYMCVFLVWKLMSIKNELFYYDCSHEPRKTKRCCIPLHWLMAYLVNPLYKTTSQGFDGPDVRTF